MFDAPLQQNGSTKYRVNYMSRAKARCFSAYKCIHYCCCSQSVSCS